MRNSLIVAAFLLLVPNLTLAQAPTAEERQKTIQYLLSLQRPSGAFAAEPKPDSPVSVGSTSAAVRALKYMGGSTPNLEGCRQFVASCQDPVTGGVGPAPGAAATNGTTAIGVLAMAEIGTPAKEIERAMLYLEKSVDATSTFEDVRIAGAAFEAAKSAGVVHEAPSAWLAVIEKMRNPDGTFGSGINHPRETGGAAAAWMRLTGSIDKDDAILKTIREAQLSSGGWGKDGKPADLEASYRILRAFHMLKANPDREAALKFVASCRNADGSYGIQPGAPGSVGATYFASIIIHWLSTLR